MTLKAPEMDREAALVRSAKTRALITGFMNKPGQTPHSLQDLLASIPELVKVHKHTPATLDRIVRNMVKNNRMIRNAEQRIHTFHLPTALEAALPKEPKVKKTKALESEIPVLSATLIKATGRVRFQLQGMIIEIGVE